ncbi:MAG: hypothetical protein E6G55_02320 [Actinobacteria bacterium]|nr:MAG: hypothetical protein E6G55_02320 [Actinomycetota bacterium]
MRSLVRRSLVAAAVGSGVILAGFTGLTHASAASSSNGSASTKATTSASATHHCDGDGNDSTSERLVDIDLTDGR